MGEFPCFLPLFAASIIGWWINTKSHGGCCRLRLIGADGDASQKTSFPSCHHRHHQCHAMHDDNSHHGSKSGCWPFKKSAFGGEKTAAYGAPL